METRARKNKIEKDVFEELCCAIGRECVCDNIEERECYSFDTTNVKSMPDLVITPHLLSKYLVLYQLQTNIIFRFVHGRQGYIWQGERFPLKEVLRLT